MHQEGSLGRTLGCALRGMLGKDGGNVHQDRGFGMCGAANSGQEEFYRDLSCPWLVCGEGRSILFAPQGLSGRY